MKVCTKCKKPKNLQEFPLDKRVFCGTSARCKKCVAKYNRQRYKRSAKERARRAQTALVWKQRMKKEGK